jgi:hypothetical protein
MQRLRHLKRLSEALQPLAGGSEAAERQRAPDMDWTTIDWAGLLALANEHLVTPALYVALRNAVRLGDLPEEVREYLGFLYAENRTRNETLRAQAVELARALNQAGIEPMLLKGAQALFPGHAASAWAADPGFRMMRDLDFQIPRDQADIALRVLLQLGYDEIARYPAGHHAYGDFARPHDPGAVDLHFELIDASYLLPAANLRTRASVMEYDGARFLVPAPSDGLLHILLHAQIHHLGNYYRGHLELRQLLDFAVYARHHAGTINWASIARHLRQHHLIGVLDAYALAAETLLDLRLSWPLSRQRGFGAHLQLLRCLAQIAWPRLEEAAIPLGNLAAAFAHYRMDGLYGRHAPLLMRRARHALRFLRKSNADGAMRRLFKTS